MAKKRAYLPSSGIEVVIGLPGAGKSYFMTRKALEVMLNEKRPVYTNLPLNLPAIRAYLRKRGGPAIANLIHHLTKEHFEKFLVRFGLRADLSTRLKSICFELTRDQDVDRRLALAKQYPDLLLIEEVSGVQRVRARSLAACWAVYCSKHNSPDIDSGPDANNIPISSIIMIDEVHHWYPGGVAGRESKELIAYITMHRHGYYHIYVATQHWGQVNVGLRRNAAHYHVCQDVGLREFVGGITFGQLGMRHFIRYQFLGGQTDEPDFKSANALVAETFWAQMPWNRWVFRVYNSHTHMDSPRAAKKMLNAQRQKLGIEPLEREVEGKAIRRKVKLMKKRYVLILCLLGFFGGMFLRPNWFKPAAAEAPKFPYKVQGVGDDFVQLDIGMVDRETNARDVMYLHGSNSSHFVLVGRDVFLLSPEQQKFIGPLSAVYAAIRSRLVTATTSPRSVAGESRAP